MVLPAFYYGAEMRGPYGKCDGVWVERSGFQTWPCYWIVFKGKTLYSHSMSLNCKEKEHVYCFPELYLK